MIKTRLTERLGIEHPIIQAPMAFAAGGELAAAVTRAGGLGMIGGGYGDPEWLSAEFEAAGNQKVGCGLITWALKQHPQLLSTVLERDPAAVFLSFGDPAPFIDEVNNSGALLICQVQTLRDAQHTIDLGADIVVAQGAEAGGHSDTRSTFTLVPEVADHIKTHAPETLLCAAGGVGDGRGLAAALMLGADGVVMGSRFWASHEAHVHPNMHEAAIAASGDQSIQSRVMDIARKLDWPDRYKARVLKNSFTDRWHNDVEGLLAVADEEAARWRAAWEAGEIDTANTFVGEVTGLINSVLPAAEIIAMVVDDAEALLAKDFS